MTLRYPSHKIASMERYVAESTTSAAAGSTIPLTDRTLVRLDFSGNGTVAVESGSEDGQYRILMVETVTGSSRIENNGNIQLVDRAWLPQLPGEVLGLIWNATDAKWYEIYRSIKYDTVSGIYVKNITGSPILRGSVVYIDGATGNNPHITLADNATEQHSARTIGLVRETIPNNDFGYVITNGLVENVNTGGMTAGQSVYLGASGAFTNIKPQAPNHMVKVGNVIRANANVGSIQVWISNGFEIDELHDVQIISPTNGQVITYDSATSLWKNTTPGGGSGLGTVTDVSVVTANGLAGSVANSTTTPAITLSTTVTGILKGNGTAISAAVAGTDYQPAGNYVTTDTVQTITATKSLSVNTVFGAGLTVTQAGAGKSIDITAGQISIPDGTAAAPAIAFRDDVNTGIFSPSNDIFGISVNGSEAVRVQQSAGTPVVLVGTSTVYGAISVDSADATGTAGVVMLGHANAGTTIQESYRGGQFAGVRSRGTKAAPTGVQTGDGLTSIIGAGWTSTGGINYGSLITMKADQTFTSSASGGRIEFHTTQNGTSGLATLGDTGTARMIIGSNNVTIQPPGDVSITPGNDLFGVANNISLSANTNIALQNAASTKFIVDSLSFQGVELNAGLRRAPYIRSAETTLNQIQSPIYSFVNDLDTGLTSTSADTVTLVTAGVARTDIDSTRIANNLQLQGIDGSAAAPSYSFSGGTGTGMWRSGKALNFAVDGDTILQLSEAPTGDQIQSVPDGTAARPAYTWINATDTGFFYDTTDTYVGLSIGGTRRLLLDATGMTSSIVGGPTVPWGAGNASAPTYGFFGDSDTGMYRVAANQLGFTTGAEQALLLDASAVTSAYTPSIITNDTGMAVGHNSSIRDLTLNTNSTARVTIAGNGNYVEIDSAIVYEPGSIVSLTIDNQAVIVGARSYLRVSSNSTISTNRTFTISNGIRLGHFLVIAATGLACELLDTGNCALSGTMTFGINDTITLLWNGTAWIELSRSNN